MSNGQNPSIQQNPNRQAELCLVWPEDGIGYANPACIGDARFIAALEKLETLDCQSGFGDFTLRKRTRGNSTTWFGFRRTGATTAEYSAGTAASMTSASLDDIALKLYAAPAQHFFVGQDEEP